LVKRAKLPIKPFSLRNLGFEHFIPGDFMNLTYPFNSGHGYPADKHMTDSILKVMKESDKPSFIHAVGLESHMPYPRDKNGSPFLNKEKMKLDTYETFSTYVDRGKNGGEEKGEGLWGGERIIFPFS